ncbi:MAG: tetratricopeptide repeat protein [Cyanobacteriota bacterium]
MDQKKRAELVEKILTLEKEDALEIAKLIIDNYKADFRGNQYIEEFLDIASDYDRLGEPEKALNIYKKAEKRALAIGDNDYLAPIYGGMGVSYNYLKEYESSVKFYQKAIKLFETSNNEQEIGIIYNNLGFVYKNILKFEEAVKSYIKAIEIFRKIDDKFSMTASYFNIADIFKSLKDYETALKYIDKCIELDKELKLDSLNDDLGYKDDLLVRLGRKSKDLTKKDENVFLDDEDDETTNDKSENKRWNWLWRKK